MVFTSYTKRRLLPSQQRWCCQAALCFRGACVYVCVCVLYVCVCVCVLCMGQRAEKSKGPRPWEVAAKSIQLQIPVLSHKVAVMSWKNAQNKENLTCFWHSTFLKSHLFLALLGPPCWAAFSPSAARRAAPWLQRRGFSLQRRRSPGAQLLGCAGSVAAAPGLQEQAQPLRPVRSSCPAARGVFPGPGVEPVSLALRGGSLTAGYHQGSPFA